MQPEAPDGLRSQPVLGQELDDEFLSGNGDFLEHLVADLLDEIAFQVDHVGIILGGAGVITQIGADVVRHLRPKARVQHLETPRPFVALGKSLHHHRHRGIAEDEMRLPVAEIEMAGDDFGRGHQDALVRARAHQIDRHVQRSSRRRTAKPHVEAGACRAERLLHFDSDRRIGPLVVRGRADDQVDL